MGKKQREDYHELSKGKGKGKKNKKTASFLDSNSGPTPCVNASLNKGLSKMTKPNCQYLYMVK